MKLVEPIERNRKFEAMGHPSRGRADVQNWCRVRKSGSETDARLTSHTDAQAGLERKRLRHQQKIEIGRDAGHKLMALDQ
jgi:hypothetical protein